jgi:hypothetical protein
LTLLCQINQGTPPSAPPAPTANWVIDIIVPLLVVVVVAAMRLFCDKVVNKKEFTATLFALPTEVLAVTFVIPPVVAIKAATTSLVKEAVAAILLFVVLVLVSLFLSKRGLDLNDTAPQTAKGYWLGNVLMAVGALAWSILLLSRV